MHARAIILVLATVCCGSLLVPAAPVLAASQHQQGQDEQKHAEEAQKAPELTPEQQMNRRFPQPIRVGDLIGLPVLDYNDSTIGYIREVARTKDGKIQLIVPYGPRFGWLRSDWGRRPVGVPIEAVAILGRQVNTLDIPRADYDDLPEFRPGDVTPIPPDEIIKIAIGRR